jgi:HK97 family phage prohead protease
MGLHAALQLVTKNKGFGAEVLKFRSAVPKEIAPRTFRFIASTPEMDRDGDVIPLEAWDLTDYQQNPVILMGHDRTQAPVARAVRVAVEDGALVADIEFPEPGTTVASDEAYKLVSGGFLRALSVGYLPLVAPQRIPNAGMRFPRVQLFELSLVSVPANASALAASFGGKLTRAKALELVAAAFGEDVATVLETEEPAPVPPEEPVPAPVPPAPEPPVPPPAAAEPLALKFLAESEPRFPLTPDDVRTIARGALSNLVAAETRRHTGRLED